MTLRTGRRRASLAEALPLPGGITPGEYEMRLSRTDPTFYGLFGVVARSEPIHIVDSTETSTTVAPGSTTTSTTIPPVVDCDVGDPTACQTGDPCSVDQCVPGVGCVSTPLDGFAGVTCACNRNVPEACLCGPTPGAVVRGHDRGCGLLFQAPPSKRTLRKAMKAFKRALAGVARERRRGELSAECLDRLDADLADARDRTGRFLAALGR